jgi:hypothetical protein
MMSASHICLLLFLLFFSSFHSEANQLKKETIDVIEDDFRLRMADAERQRLAQSTDMMRQAEISAAAERQKKEAYDKALADECERQAAAKRQNEELRLKLVADEQAALEERQRTCHSTMALVDMICI